tara:strand:+ start:14 stop:634 length:621 start_codon:yes stop_codon:yes gene_type:complete
MTRVFKPDSGQTLEIQDEGGSAALTIETDGDIQIANNIDTGTIGASVVFPAGGTGNPISVAIICDQKSDGVNGGGSTLGSFETRALNTTLSDPDSIVTISSDQFILGAGTYHIYFQSPNYQGNASKAALNDITGSAILTFSTNIHSGSGDAVSLIASGSFIHSPSSSNTYEIRQRVEATKAANGWGTACGFGVAEIYTLVIISKLK